MPKTKKTDSNSSRDRSKKVSTAKDRNLVERESSETITETHKGGDDASRVVQENIENVDPNESREISREADPGSKAIADQNPKSVTEKTCTTKVSCAARRKELIEKCCNTNVDGLIALIAASQVLH